MTKTTAYSLLECQLSELLEDMLKCPPDAPPGNIRSAVYVFSEAGKHLYVGKTDRLPARLREHKRGKNNDAPFAFMLACEEVGEAKKPRSKTRSQLEACPEFKEAFKAAKERVAKMEFRWVEVKNPNLQYLFEFYAAIELKSKYNSFRNH